MTKNLHEPSTPREVAANRYSGKLTQQRPYAYQWVTPVNVADCPADPYSLTDPRPAWTPCYVNDWERPTTLEPLSVRLSADGTLQWQGYVNSAIATSAIAFIMPGTLSGEPDMIPDVSVGENLSYNVFTTPDDGTTIVPGRAYIDSTTGEVSIYPQTATRPWIVLENLGQTLPTTTSKFSLFTDAWWDPALVTGDPLVSGADDNPYFSLDISTEDALDYWVLTTKLEGWYTLELVSSWGQFTSPPGTAGYACQFINFTTTGIPFNLDKNIREAKDWSTGAVNELEAAARLDTYRTIWLPASKAWDGVKVQQTSGADRDVAAHLKVWYEAGNFGGSGDNADWTFASV